MTDLTPDLQRVREIANGNPCQCYCQELLDGPMALLPALLAALDAKEAEVERLKDENHKLLRTSPMSVIAEFATQRDKAIYERGVFELAAQELRKRVEELERRKVTMLQRELDALNCQVQNKQNELTIARDLMNQALRGAGKEEGDEL